MSIHEFIGPSTDSVSVSMRPGAQERDWRQRWAQVQRDLHALLAPRSEPLSGRAIHEARDRLLAFYVLAYHLKDALIHEADITGVPGKDVENAITSDPVLALLADLANLEKHPEQRRSPRSGERPKVESISGSSLATPPDRWRLDVIFRHGERRLDGLEAAEQAVVAWRRWLRQWRLLGPAETG